MKILHFYNGRCHSENLSGVPKTVYNLARYQSKIGHSVSIYNLTEKPVLEIGDGVSVRNFKPIFRGWRIPNELKSAILELAPAVIHLHSIYVPANSAVARFARRHQIPYVVTPHGNCNRNLLKRRPWLKIPFKYLIEKPCLNRALFVHSVGDTDAIKDYGVTAPIVMAPNGIEFDNIPEMAKNNPILEARPDWHDHTIFAFVGRLDTEQKGLDLMLQGLAKASERKSIGLVIVGPDWKNRRSRLERLVDMLGLRSSVYFAGAAYGAEKFDFIHSADFFIHTSRWEGLSFSVIEALACGKPCMVTDAANPCGLIGPYNAGSVVISTIESIGNGFDRLSRLDPAEREVMRKEAIRLIQSECRWESIAEKITKAYTE